MIKKTIFILEVISHYLYIEMPGGVFALIAYDDSARYVFSKVTSYPTASNNFIYRFFELLICNDIIKYNRVPPYLWTNKMAYHAVKDNWHNLQYLSWDQLDNKDIVSVAYNQNPEGVRDILYLDKNNVKKPLSLYIDTRPIVEAIKQQQQQTNNN